MDLSGLLRHVFTLLQIHTPLQPPDIIRAAYIPRGRRVRRSCICDNPARITRLPGSPPWLEVNASQLIRLVSAVLGTSRCHPTTAEHCTQTSKNSPSHSPRGARHIQVPLTRVRLIRHPEEYREVQYGSRLKMTGCSDTMRSSTRSPAHAVRVPQPCAPFLVDVTSLQPCDRIFRRGTEHAWPCKRTETDVADSLRSPRPFFSDCEGLQRPFDILIRLHCFPGYSLSLHFRIAHLPLSSLIMKTFPILAALATSAFSQGINILQPRSGLSITAGAPFMLEIQQEVRHPSLPYLLHLLTNLCYLRTTSSRSSRAR